MSKFVLRTSPEDKYETVTELFKGKFSSVYTGKLKNCPGQGNVVIKRNSIVYCALNEIKTYKNLNNSEQFLKVFDICKNYTIVFERCMCDLEKLLLPQLIVPKEQKNLALQFLKGLNAIHAKELVHGDIKLRNILITYDGILKIADFESVSGNKTEPPTRVRTSGYIAPEALISTSPLLAHYSRDLWAAGIILFKIFTNNKKLIARTSAESEIKTLTRLFGCPSGPYYESLPGYTEYHIWASSYTKNNIPKYLKGWMSLHTQCEIDLVGKLLQLEPSDRCSAGQLIHAESFVVEPLPCTDLTEAMNRYMEAMKITRPPPHEASEIDWNNLILKKGDGN